MARNDEQPVPALKQENVPHDSKDAPGGAAQFDPAQQTQREDIEDPEKNGEGQVMRGNLKPGAGASDPSRRPEPAPEELAP